MSALPEEIVVSDGSSPPPSLPGPATESEQRASPRPAAPFARASTSPRWPGARADEKGADEDEAMPDAPNQSIITHISDDEGGEDAAEHSDGVSDSHAGSEESGDEDHGEDSGDEQDVDAALDHAGPAAQDDEEEEDDDDDDDDDSDGGGAGAGEEDGGDGDQDEQDGQREGSSGRADPSEDVNLADAPAEEAETKKKGYRKTRLASPASVDEDDVVMPTSAPTRPTVRLPLAFDMDPHHDTPEAYTMDFPKLLIAHLKPQGDKWATWFEGQATSKDPEEVPMPLVPEPVPEGMDDLGEFAGLLARHPVEKKKRKKRLDDPHDVGAYDTKDPFVDDSELVVDEPVYFARSTRGFFVAAGAANLSKPGKKKKRAIEAVTVKHKGEERERKSSHLSAIMAIAVRIDGGDTGATAMAQHFWHERVLHEGPIKVDLPNLPADVDAQDSLARTAVDMSWELAEAALAAPQGGEAEVQARLALSGAKRGLASPACLIPLAHRIDERVTVSEPAVETPGAKKRAYDPKPLPGPLVVGLAALYALRNMESFAVKSKFPPGLKQPLMRVARLALDLGVYNNNFFDWLPSVLPYNRFTLRKLTIREFFADNLASLESLQEESLARLRDLTSKHLQHQQNEWEKAVRAHEPDPEAEEPEAAPSKKWKFTEDEKEEIWLSVVLGDAMTELKNDKFTLEKQEGISDIMSRKTVYRKIAERWPEDGWVTSTIMSTQFNSVKKKLERLMRLADE